MPNLNEQIKQAAEQALLKRKNEIAGRELTTPPRLPGPVEFLDVSAYRRMQAQARKPDVKPVSQQTYQELVQGPLDQWRQTAPRSPNGWYNSPTNVNGDELPYGAVGWDYNSQPYYGNGLKGWLNGLWSKLTAPVPTNDQKEPWFAVTKIGTTPPTGGAAGGSPALAKYLQDKANQEAGTPDTTTGELTLPDIGKTWENLKEGKAGTVVGKATQAVSGVVEAGLQAAGEPARKAEQALSVLAAAPEMGAGSPLPEFKDAPQWLQTFTHMAAPGLVNAYNDLRILTAPTSLEDKKQQIDEAYQAGRILYSSILDPGKRQEYIRRYQAGENPYMLAQELENPIPEAVGQLILDPLNVIGFATRAARDANRIASAEDLYLKLPKTFEDGVQALKAAATDERAAQAIADLATLQISKSAEVAQGLDDFAKQLGLSALTSTGKQSVVSRTTGTVFQTILANMPQDDALEHLRGLWLLASDKPDDVAQGLAVVRNSNIPRVMLSKAGDQLGVVLRKVIGDDPNAFLKAVQEADTLDAQLALANGRMGKAIGEMFPTIAERVKAGEKLPFTARAVAAFDNKMQTVFSKVNSLFSAVYMGLSPGFAFRNFATNSLHIAVDEGTSALLKTPASALEDMKTLLGGAIPKAVGGYGQATGGAETARYATKFPFTALSNKFEEWGSIQVAYSAVKRTMRAMLQPGRAIPDVAPLIEKGMSEDNAATLVRLVVENKGDVGKALETFREAAKTGDYPVFKTLKWVGKDDAAALDEFNKAGDVLDALNSSTSADEAATKLRTIFQGIIDDAKKVSNDLSVAPSDTEVGEVAKVLTGTDMPDAWVAMAQDHLTANTAANGANQQAIWDLINGAIAQAKEAGDEEAIAKLGELQAKYRTVADGTLGAEAKLKDVEFNGRWIEGWHNKYASQAKRKELNIGQAWKDLGQTGAPPSSWGELRNFFWDEFYWNARKNYWNTFRETLAGHVDDVFRQVNDIIKTDGSDVLLQRAQAATERARQFDNFLPEGVVRFKVQDAIAAGDNAKAARLYAQQFGIPTATEKGVPLDKALLNYVNANLPEGAEKYAALNDVPPEVSRKALLAHITPKSPVETAKVAAELAKTEWKPVQPPPKAYAGNTPTPSRALTEQIDGIKALFYRLEKGIKDNWGSYEPVNVKGDLLKAIDKWGKEAQGRVTEARLISSAVADAAREFTLLNYQEKRTFDLALNYIYPYHFWYNRTYTNWIKRIATNPDTIAAYAKYRDALAKIHAGAPAWWKYNINSNELLGINSENPLFFNLEATLNPLNGLTGVDFNDPEKRKGFFTSLVDDLGKFGPSVWTPYSIAVAFGLYLKGENDAAARWGGRLIPQTSTIKSALSLMNVNVPTPGGGVNEFDPSVLFFSNGMDPYERRRVGRMLGQMVDQGDVSAAQALDAARTQSGDIWRQADELAIRQRAGGQLSSFAFGVGFKARSIQDIQIDSMYNAMARLGAQKDLLSPDEYRRQWDQMRQDYPFMDTVLLSYRAGAERDTAYAYNVLSRIPPGQKDDLAQAAGISSDLFSKFYDAKGDMSQWPESDRQKFMAAMVDLGAVLDLPDTATRQEWQNASQGYQNMLDMGQKFYGADIWTKVDAFYALGDDQEAKDAYLNDHPDVSAAMDWRSQTLLSDPTLAPYYSSLDKIQKFYNGQMYDAIEKELGTDIYQKWDEYFALKDAGDKTYKKYWKDHPELAKYMDLKEQYSKIASDLSATVAKTLREAQAAGIRPDLPANPSTGVQSVLDLMQNPPQGANQMTWQDWQGVLPDTLQRLVVDDIYGGKQLSEAAMKQLDGIAQDMGLLDGNEALQLIENVLH